MSKQETLYQQMRRRPLYAECRNLVIEDANLRSAFLKAAVHNKSWTGAEGTDEHCAWLAGRDHFLDTDIVPVELRRRQWRTLLSCAEYMRKKREKESARKPFVPSPGCINIAAVQIADLAAFEDALKRASFDIA